jgi:hypothetical protein
MSWWWTPQAETALDLGRLLGSAEGRQNRGTGADGQAPGTSRPAPRSSRSVSLGRDCREFAPRSSAVVGERHRAGRGKPPPLSPCMDTSSAGRRCRLFTDAGAGLAPIARRRTLAARQLDSERRLERAAADGWFRREGAGSPRACARRPSCRSLPGAHVRAVRRRVMTAKPDAVARPSVAGRPPARRAARTACSLDFTPWSWRTSLRCASGRQRYARELPASVAEQQRGRYRPLP